MIRGTTVVCLVVAALGLVACGGKSSTKATVTPTRAAPTVAPTAMNIPMPTVTGEPTVTSTGLKIQDLQVGTGQEAKASDTITVNYTGWLEDGTTFDSTAAHGGPYSTAISDVIQGWIEGVPGMKVGGIRRLIIPPELAYGKRQIGKIPPNSTLIFDIELISISNP